MYPSVVNTFTKNTLTSTPQKWRTIRPLSGMIHGFHISFDINSC